ncbi:MAG: HNH endonuclease signature motif containing protein, partial [Burkholderiaceae bacterium]
MEENKPLAIPQELLDEVRYEKGNLYWAVPKQGRSAKKPICHDRDRYASVNYRGKRYLLHRVIYALHYGDPCDLHIDHINLNKRDNRIENLR